MRYDGDYGTPVRITPETVEEAEWLRNRYSHLWPFESVKVMPPHGTYEEWRKWTNDLQNEWFCREADHARD